MAKSIEFKMLLGAELEKSLGKEKSFTEKYPKKSYSTGELKVNLKNWQKSVSKQVEPQIKLTRIAAVPIKEKEVTSLRAIHESATPTAEAIVIQKMAPEKIVGTLFSSINTLEFIKMEAEYKTRLKDANSPAAKAKVDEDWKNVVQAGSDVFAAGGLKGVNEAKLRSFSTELTKNKNNFTAIVNIANTGLAVRGLTAQDVTAQSALQAGFVPQTGVLLDEGLIVTEIKNLCSSPFASGTFTKHFHKGFSLVVQIPYWCPTWRKPWRVCYKNVTLAGLSLDINVQVGYRVTCCGATVWGQASAQACATLVGITFCAGCSARIIGVAGIGRTGSGSNCTYGIGINAQLTCTFGNVTVLSVQAPFGYNINGPCPPAGLC